MTRLASFDALCIDLDGTLADTLQDMVAAVNSLLADEGLPEVSYAQVLAGVGNGTRALLEFLQPEAPYEQIDRWQRAYPDRYRLFLGRHSQLYAGALPALRALRAAGWPLACTTNKPSSHALPLLTQLAVADCFDVLVCADQAGARKPDPAMLLKAAYALGVAPERMCLIGDSDNDIGAARAAGCSMIAVRCGYGGFANQLQVPDSLLLADDFAQATAWILESMTLPTSSAS